MYGVGVVECVFVFDFVDGVDGYELEDVDV